MVIVSTCVETKIRIIIICSLNISDTYPILYIYVDMRSPALKSAI